MTEPESSEPDMPAGHCEAHDSAGESGGTADPALAEPELHALMRRAMIGRGNVDPDEVMAQIGSEVVFAGEEASPPEEAQATIFAEEDELRGYSWEP